METRELSRQRLLTEPAYESFSDNVKRYEQSFARIQTDIDGLITALSNASGSDTGRISDYIQRNFNDYDRLTKQYVDFLIRSRTYGSEQLRHSHMIAYESLKASVSSALEPNPDHRVSQDTLSQSGSHRSSTSSTRSTILRKKAQLEATKTKTKYAKQQMELMRQKLALDAELNLMEIKKEAETLEAEIRVMESETLVDDDKDSDLSSVRRRRTSEYVQKLSSLKSSETPHTKLDNPTSELNKAYTNITGEHTITELQSPQENPSQSQDRSKAPNKTVNFQTSLPTIQLQSPTQVNSPVYIQSSLSQQPPSTQTNSPAVVSSSIQLPPPTQTNLSGYIQPSISQQLPPFQPQGYSGSPHVIPQPTAPNLSHVQLCDIMTRMIARKDVVLSRLVKFNDSPVRFLSWKQTFLAVTKELGVTPAEELDLLIRWLGPESARQAESVKVACAFDYPSGLKQIWSRLDNRYGSPEVIEDCLRKKLDKFPKMSAFNCDYKRLFELYDILCEFQCTKNNPQYSQVLAYLDSSSGVNPIVSRLPPKLQDRWSLKASKYKKDYHMMFPPFDFFVEFVHEMANFYTDPSFQFGNTNTKVPGNTSSSTNTKVSAHKADVVENGKKHVCPIHQTNHELKDCRAFREKPISERKDLLKTYKLCFRCCGSKPHRSKNCVEKFQCKVCQSKEHPTALHVNQPKANSTETKTEKTDSPHGGESQALASACTKVCGNPEINSKSCAKILPVYIYPLNQREVARKVYALIDDQSSHTLATPELLNSFDSNCETISYSLSTCSGKISLVGRKARNFCVESMTGDSKITIPSIIECSDIPNNRDEIPSPSVVNNFSHLRDLSGQICDIETDISIGLLIGRDIIIAHHVLDQRLGNEREPYAQKLPLGWVVVGESCLGQTHRNDIISVNKTSLLSSGRATHMVPCENQFSLKEDDIFKRTQYDETLGPSIEDGQFLELMDRNVTKDNNGNWQAPLPFRQGRPKLPNNRCQALKRLEILDRSLNRDPTKKDHVLDFMGKMLERGHAEKAPDTPFRNERWYLPFFGVYNSKKPGKIRMVFDSSAQYVGTSLNDILLKGPDMTNSLLGVLLRFRQEEVAFMTDVEQMFYNFKVIESDRDFLRFVWHDNNNLNCPIVDYRMTVHVFGNSPSPAVATYCLRKSVEEADKDVQDFVCRNFYVDDGLKSCSDISYAIDLLKRSQSALSKGGNLRLHKIVSNNELVLQSFPSNDLSIDLKDLDLGSEIPPIQRSLGISWDISSDTFVFRVSKEPKPYTRRGALSVINSIFDPIGFVAPITICGKLLLREMIHTKAGPIDWDENLPDVLRQKWEQWVSSLVELEQFRIPRMYCSMSYSGATRREVHIFSDASKDAIASVAYLKLISDNSVNVAFLMGKSKVAPTHGHTIPRLELCAAVLSVEISDILKHELEIDSCDIYYYSDSQVVLGYINNVTRRFYVYVSNRVNRIRAASLPKQWHYVPTDQNPADIATRHLKSSDLQDSAYISGPSFLQETAESDYQDFPLVEPNFDKEIRPQVISVKTNVHKVCNLSERFSRFSSWDSLVSALLVIKSFVRRFQKANKPSRQEVERFIIRTVQEEVFSDELTCASLGQKLPLKSDILPLSPILDQDNILRVGGRLKYSKDWNTTYQPIIIPKKHHIATLLVRHYHGLVIHQGRHFTEGALRTAGFWVIGSKRLVASIIRQCVVCKKLRGNFCVQRMSDLPEDRLNVGPPFSFVGVDAFGPWPVLQRKTRGGSAQQKRWGILFTCLVSRAIHIEVTDELSSAAFINAFRRFIALRGPVKEIRSDRGTNFMGAISDLGISAQFCEDGSVAKLLSSYGTMWRFNPPHASHFGGSWERMIGVSRRILDAMILKEKHRLTHDSLLTLMAEVCAIVNSRPLLNVSTDPDYPEVLSPSILLTHKQPFNEPVLSNFNVKDMIRHQWKLVQGLSEEFWSKWSKEYIHTLQSRQKWHTPTDNLHIGDVVLMKDCDLHRSQWPLAVIINVFPSEDGLVRKVELKCIRDDRSVKYVRPITELVLLVPSA